MDKDEKRRKLSKRAKLQIAGGACIILLIMAAAAYTLWVKPAMNREKLVYTEQEAQYGELKNSVTESGTVEFGLTTQVYDLDISTDDEEDDDDDEEETSEKYLKVADVYVAVGQRITEGDKICSFTQDSIEDVRKTLTYAKTEAQIALSNAQTAYNTGVLEAGLSRNETILDTSLAQTTYDNTIARLTNDMAAKTLEIEQLLADIYDLQLELTDEDYLEEKADIAEAYEKAKQGVEDASEDYVTNQVEAAQTFWSAKESYETFFDQFDESNQQIEEKVNEVYSIQEEILYSQQLLEKELLTAQQELDTSNISGSIADTKYESSLTVYENALSRAQSELDEATQRLEDFESFVGDGTIYASGSGLVTEVGYEKDDYLVNAGVLVSFAAPEDMTVSVDVSQEDVVTMKVGDSVDIVFAAYDDQTYKGTIQSITTTATSRSSATISYPVVVSIQGDTSKLYAGMTASVSFVTEQTGEVVYIPRKAVVEQDGKTYVYKKEGEEYQLIPVVTGFTNGESVEITEGLDAGEQFFMEVREN